jgi:hypothetical protein
MLMHLTAPFNLYGGAPFPAPTRMIELHADEIAGMTPLLRQRLLDTSARMREAGFGIPLFAVPAGQTNDHSVYALFERNDRRALAFIDITEGARIPMSLSFSIMTRLDDGWYLGTTNYGFVARFPQPPLTDGVRIVDCDDPLRLWSIHEFRVRLHEARARVVPMTRGLDPLRFELDEDRASQEHWVASGYVDRLPDGCLKFTPLGAWLAAWRGLWPWKQWTTWREDRRTAAVLRAYRTNK